MPLLPCLDTNCRNATIGDQIMSRHLITAKMTDAQREYVQGVRKWLRESMRYKDVPIDLGERNLAHEQDKSKD